MHGKRTVKACERRAVKTLRFMGETKQLVSSSSSFTLDEVPLTGYEVWRMQDVCKFSLLLYSWIKILWKSIDSLVITTAREIIRISLECTVGVESLFSTVLHSCMWVYTNYLQNFMKRDAGYTHLTILLFFIRTIYKQCCCSNHITLQHVKIIWSNSNFSSVLYNFVDCHRNLVNIVFHISP